MPNKLQTNEKEFLAEIAQIAASARSEAEASATGLDPSPAARAERRRRVLQDWDFEFFAYTYFKHHIRPPASQFHVHFFGRFPSLLGKWAGAKEWWVAPRGEAKSSLLSKVGPCFVAVVALLQRAEVRTEIGWQGEAPYFIDYITLLGAETKLPAKLLEVVKAELTYNQALMLDFPEACGATRNWKIGEFTTTAGVKMESFGAEQAIRGTFHGASRPKLLIGDDLITDKEAKSPTECNNRWDWLEKAIDYLGPPEGNVKFIGVGTVLAKSDPISRAKSAIGHLVHHFRAIIELPRRMDLWEQCQGLMMNADKPAEEAASTSGSVLPETQLPSFLFYQAHQADMDQGAVISWPGVRTLFWLMRQRAKNMRAFNTEMQGEPRTEEDKVFGHITFNVEILSHWLMFGGCDPSMGKGESSHPSALIAGAWDRQRGRLHVLDARIKRRLPSKLEADLIRFQRDHQCLAIGFENNNAYEHSRQTFVTAGITAGVALPLVGLPESVEREVRIDGLEPYITDAITPRISFDPSLTQLLAELDQWPEPPAGHDYDGLCALYILWKLCVTRGGTAGAHSGFRSAARHAAGTSDLDDGYSGRRMI
jgi:predicted phage terminase large subunit-like protein